MTAWFDLLSTRYPDPLHTGEHPFRIELPDRLRQPRLVTLFRLPLALPALVLTSAFNVVLSLASVAAWFVALALGRTTAGLQELGTFCLRYQLETQAYVTLLTSAYPRLAPPTSRQRPNDLVVLREAPFLLLREDQVPVGDDVELALLARDGLGVVSGALVQLGRETRGPAVIAVSDGAVEDLDLHVPEPTEGATAVARKSGPEPACCAITQMRAAPRSGSNREPGRLQ